MALVGSNLVVLPPALASPAYTSSSSIISSTGGQIHGSKHFREGSIIESLDKRVLPPVTTPPKGSNFGPDVRIQTDRNSDSRQYGSLHHELARDINRQVAVAPAEGSPGVRIGRGFDTAVILSADHSPAKDVQQTSRELVPSALKKGLTLKNLLPSAAFPPPPLKLSPERTTVAKVCKAKGCHNPVLWDGVCKDHGTKAKHPRCKVEECFKQAVRGGVCISHGAVVRYNRCKVDGCHKYARSRGVCVQHGATSPRCRVVDCNKQAVQGGVCIGHGARVKYKRCKIEGCTTHASTVGLCPKHRATVEYTSCSINLCSRYAKIAGKCILHYKTTSEDRPQS